MIKKTPYELWKGRRHIISYFHPCGCKCFIINTIDQLTKFDSMVDKGIFLVYSDTSKGYRLFNPRTLVMDQSSLVNFNYGLTIDRKLSNLEDNFADT